MKKIILSSSILLCLAFIQPIKAQTFVSTEPSNRNVVLEEYTGITCQFCPGGHKVANQLAAANPGKVIIVNIHQGVYANAVPDYRTQWGDALAAQAGLTGYPSGTVNRHIFSGSVIALDREKWITSATQILSSSSCVNVAAKSELDWGKRQLKITVEAYYTENSNSSTNLLNVAILQENVIGPQIVNSSVAYPEMQVGNLYRHNHMLRDLVTGQWGETISETTEGSFFTKTYTYDIPYNIGNIFLNPKDITVAVFIAENRKEIITGAISSITEVYAPESDLLMSNVIQAEHNTCDDEVRAKVCLQNISSQNINSYTLKYVVDGVENTDTIYNVTGRNVASGMCDTITLPAIRSIANQRKNLTVTVIKANNKDLDLISSKQKTIAVTKDTTVTTAGALTIKIWQDRYGSETSWKLFDSEGEIITSGGPYTNLGANGTQLHTIEKDTLASGCYYFQIDDTYGDGINGGAGAGKYEIWIGENKIFSSDGKFGYGESKYFKVTGDIGINTVNRQIGNLEIYPNPVKDKMTVSFTLDHPNSVIVSIYDVLGKEVMALNKASYGEGIQNVNINTQQLNNGIYIVKVQTQEGVISKKILINK